MFEQWFDDLININEEAGDKLNNETYMLIIAFWCDLEDRFYS